MKLTRKRLMEVAGLPINESADVIKAINKNKAALSAAIKKRLADPEDMDAHDAVEKLIIKTAIEAGMDKQEAQDIPWMETYAVPGDSTVARDLEELQIEIEDALANPDTTSTGSSNSSGEEIIKVLEELGTFDNMAKTLDQIGAAYTKGASQGVYLIGGGGTDPIVANIVNPTEGLSSMYTYQENVYAVRDGDKMFAVFAEYSSEIEDVVEIKNNKPVGENMSLTKQMQTKFLQKLKTIDAGNPMKFSGAYTHGAPSKLGLSIPWKKFHEESNLEISEEVDDVLNNVLLFLSPLKNPVMTGKVKVPEFSKIQSEMVSLAKAGKPVVAPTKSYVSEIFKSYPLPSSDDTKSLVDWFRNTLKAIAAKSVNESIFEQIVKVKRQLLK